MTLIDLHPEELLDKEQEQSLTSAERSFLEAHLRDCVACRLLRQAGQDFRDERAFWQADEHAASLLCPSVMKQVQRRARPRTEHAAMGSLAGVRIGRRIWHLVAALAVAGSAAAASGLIAGWVGRDRPAAGAVVQPPPSIRPHTGRTGPQPGLDSAALTARSADGPPQRDAPRGVVRAAPTAVRQPTERQDQTAAQLFDRATRARVEGDYRESLRLYRDLERLYPASSESRASRAAVARLLLDMGRPDAALADLDEYLAHRPAALAEEAMVNRALAYQRLGLKGEERNAWQALLKEYPRSLYAARGQVRIDELDAGTRD